MSNKVTSIVAASVSLGLTATSFGAASYTTNFESSPPVGQLPGGVVDNRTAGGGQWFAWDNAATFGEVRGGVGLGGSNGLVVGNRGNTNDGVIDNVKSPRLAESAGETGTSSGANGTTAGNNTFSSSFWFRTASAAAPASGELRFRNETYGPDRTSFFGVTGLPDGSLNAFSSGYNTSGIPVATSIASGMTYGAWYHLVTTITFVDGGAANDTVTYQLYDASDNPVGSSTNSTWEEGARQQGFNGGNVFAVDAMQFQSRFGFTGDHVYVDDVTYSVSVVPEPDAVAIVALGAGALLLRRRHRTG